MGESGFSSDGIGDGPNKGGNRRQNESPSGGQRRRMKPSRRPYTPIERKQPASRAGEVSAASFAPDIIASAPESFAHDGAAPGNGSDTPGTPAASPVYEGNASGSGNSTDLGSIPSGVSAVHRDAPSGDSTMLGGIPSGDSTVHVGHAARLLDDDTAAYYASIAERQRIREAYRDERRGRRTGEPQTRKSSDDFHSRRDDGATPQAGGRPSRRNGENGGWKIGRAPLVDPYRDEAPVPLLKRRWVKIAGVVCAVLVIAVIAFLLNPPTYTVTVNGQEATVRWRSSAADLVKQGLASPQPGNFVAVDGTVLEEGKGNPLSATIDGEQADEGALKLHDGAEITIENGTDITEPYTEETAEVQPPVTEVGTGALHVYVGGEPGVVSRRTGEISGKTADVTVQEPVEAVYRHYNADTGDDKVIALTFDDGPWANPATTAEILDVLAENDAKATFFTVGERITDQTADVVKRASDEGHQICTHSYDHADGSGQGVNITYMSPDEQIAEVEKGYEAIENATGKEASRAFRSPGGNFYGETLSILRPYITSEIGWNIDTEDWTRPGADVIAQRLLSADPGEVILMHDGGGDRTETAEALRQALPQLREQGFRFITIDELLAYGIPEEQPAE